LLRTGSAIPEKRYRSYSGIGDIKILAKIEDVNRRMDRSEDKNPLEFNDL
jgi:hypothetical protein